MTGISISLDAKTIQEIDIERRWVQRSVAISKALEYLLSQPGTIRKLCGADKIPEEYKQ